MLKYLATFFALSLSIASQAEIIPGKETAFITGANRGIGLEFVNKYSERGWNVIATARNPEDADDLKKLAAKRKNITIEQLDITDHKRIEALAQKYQKQPIDHFVSNAAITPKYMSAFRSVKGIDFDMARKSLEVNAIGPLKLAQAFMSHVKASKEKKMLMISSRVASFADSPKRAMMYSYRASKTALNMYMYTLAFETAENGVILTLISPGTVNTMGWIGKLVPANISTDESVTNMLVVFDKLTPADNGKFLSSEDGSIIPW
jgi:NAD(P)-dependent dehydrogenase (short-subunit alcohol dehydrogenase family)